MSSELTPPMATASRMRIPFKLPSFSDWDEADGFLYLEGDYLVVEYTIVNLGMFRQEPCIVKAERGVVVGLEAHRGWFRDRLIIETTSIQLMRDVPGKHAEGVELRTKRKHRDTVERFIDVVHAWVDRLPPGQLRPAR